MKFAIISIVLIFNAIATEKIVYGEDNRLDWYESNNATFRELALSTAAMVKPEVITVKNDTYTLKSRSLKNYIRACEGTRFANQPTAATCSGFLVGEDLLVTAGHCIKTKKDCESYKWIFGYKYESKNSNPNQGSISNIYNCKEIVEQKLSNFLWIKNDYALIKLDRKVTDRRVLKINKGAKVSAGTPLVVIGHPTGLPQKIADGAVVSKTKSRHFLANLDTFGGNSGSAVFNAQTGEVEGILVRGESDYKQRTTGCREVRFVSDKPGEEGVSYIQNIKALR